MHLFVCALHVDIHNRLMLKSNTFVCFSFSLAQLSLVTLLIVQLIVAQLLRQINGSGISQAAGQCSLCGQ